MLKGLRRDFRQRYPLLNDLAIDICVGLLIEFLFVPLIYLSPWPVSVVLEGTWPVRNIGDNIADALTRLSSAVPASPRQSTPFVFVDINEATWTAWGSPLITPRDRLAALIETVSRLGPAVVLVDVDLSFPMARGDTDERLQRLLGDYGEATPPRPPLVLVRPLIAGGTVPSKALEERPTVYDAAAAPNIIWASTFFEVSPDALVRRWRLVEVVCDHGAPKLVPSVELVLAVISAGRRADFEKFLRGLTPPNCSASPPFEGATLDLGHERSVGFGDGEVQRRIIYSVKWDRANAAQASRPRFLGPQVEFQGRLGPLVTVLPVNMVLNGGPEEGATQGPTVSGLADLFAGRIVIVGGSFEQSGDIHLTPLGPMPGAMIVINAVHALQSFGTPYEPNLYARLAWSLALVVMTSLAFHFLRPGVAVATMAAVLLTLTAVTLNWFRSGLILDMAVPATGVLIHRQYLSLAGFTRAVRKEGWRALRADSEEG